MKAHDFAALHARRYAMAVGVAAAAACAIVAWVDAPRFFQSWLAAWLLFLGIALGSMVNVMVHELTGGVWGFAIRRPLEAAIGTVPVMAVLAIPLLFGLPDLYPWARPLVGPEVGMLAAKRWYLNAPFFETRAVAYFVVWTGLAFALRSRWKRGQTNAGTRPHAQLRTLAIAGLIAYALTITFAATDWIVSLSVDWYSTAFGMLTMVSQSLAAFAFAVACAALAGDLHTLTNDAAHTARDLGNLLLTYVMLWAYLAFMQFLIIWAEDLPHEIGWYVERATPGWKALAIVVLVLQFAAPFVAMLFRGFKRHPRRLAALCAVVLVAHTLDIVWLVAPSFRIDAPWRHWTDVVAMVAVGGLWLGAFLTLYADSPVMHAPDPSPPGVAVHG